MENNTESPQFPQTFYVLFLLVFNMILILLDHLHQNKHCQWYFYFLILNQLLPLFCILKKCWLPYKSPCSFPIFSGLINPFHLLYTILSHYICSIFDKNFLGKCRHFPVFSKNMIGIKLRHPRPYFPHYTGTLWKSVADLSVALCFVPKSSPMTLCNSHYWSHCGENKDSMKHSAK